MYQLVRDVFRTSSRSSCSTAWCGCAPGRSCSSPCGASLHPPGSGRVPPRAAPTTEVLLSSTPPIAITATGSAGPSAAGRQGDPDRRRRAWSELSFDEIRSISASRRVVVLSGPRRIELDALSPGCAVTWPGARVPPSSARQGAGAASGGATARSNRRDEFRRMRAVQQPHTRRVRILASVHAGFFLLALPACLYYPSRPGTRRWARSWWRSPSCTAQWSSRAPGCSGAAGSVRIGSGGAHAGAPLPAFVDHVLSLIVRELYVGFASPVLAAGLLPVRRWAPWLAVSCASSSGAWPTRAGGVLEGRPRRVAEGAGLGRRPAGARFRPTARRPDRRALLSFVPGRVPSWVHGLRRLRRAAATLRLP